MTDSRAPEEPKDPEGLLLFRFIQLAWHIVTGKADRIIASHEAEELMEELEMVAPHAQPDVHAKPRSGQEG